MIRKTLISFFTATTLLTSAPMPVQTQDNLAQTTETSIHKEWEKDSHGWWYRRPNGSYPKNQWERIGGKWYHFDSRGYMQTGWLKISGKWYFLGSSGAMVTGWKKINGKWYCFNKSGALLTGWQYINNRWYYMNASGAMQTGWQKISGKWYYMDSSGAMTTRWQKINGKWYYFNKSGAMQTGWIKLSEDWYYLNSSGAMVTGTQIINSKEYTFDSSGRWLENGIAKTFNSYTAAINAYKEKYGLASSINSGPYNGLWYVQLIDFDRNGAAELVLGVNDENIVFEKKNGKVQQVLRTTMDGWDIGPVTCYSVEPDGNIYLRSISRPEGKITYSYYGYYNGKFQLVMKSTYNGNTHEKTNEGVITLQEGYNYIEFMRYAEINRTDVLQLSLETIKNADCYCASPIIISGQSVSGGIEIKWNESKGAAKYRIYRCDNTDVSIGNTYQFIRLADTNSLSYIDKTASKNKQYVYIIQCLSSDGKINSTYGNYVLVYRY